jgi:hypothetical protein
LTTCKWTDPLTFRILIYQILTVNFCSKSYLSKSPQTTNVVVVYYIVKKINFNARVPLGSMGTGQYEQKFKFQEFCGLHLKQRCPARCPWAFFCPPRLFQMSAKTFSNARQYFFKCPPRLFQMSAKTFSNAHLDFCMSEPTINQIFFTQNVFFK